MFCGGNYLEHQIGIKKSLKIPKGQSEAVNHKTDNAMAKRKRTNNNLQNLTQKTKDQATQIPLKLRKCYSCHHDLIYRYRVSVSQMTTDMFRLL
jgi:hypothetical protein